MDTCDMMMQLEMWLLRRMLRISWTNRVTHEEVLNKANVDKKLLNDIVSKKMKFFGHVISCRTLL